ncbi:cell wall / vacuolar inhibitor of fructosidase 1-like [Alnus glutinosa]|uniref:cell wall / vacuolar inhibitor of fructosidase 1-like n=1 Tax=Alnus glutinosa TaxID=3517 RepID=UPI002D781569|nr:cell wall / vacuolar inhibitor of fructosidase 1-like [Alnus glutinosa]
MKLLMLIILLVHVAATLPTDGNNLIEQTCRRTPFYDVCISSLKSKPRSSGADVTGLALTMVDVLKTKATETLNHIKALLHGSPKLKRSLRSCADSYKAIIEGDVPEAIEALKKGNPKFAEQGANDAADEATSCEGRFSGRSPLTDMNKAVHDVAAVAAAIVRNLL